MALQTQSSPAAGLIVSMRPRQWIKNLLVVAVPLASGQLLPLHSLDIDASDSNRLEPTRYDQLLGAINLPQAELVAE